MSIVTKEKKPKKRPSRGAPTHTPAGDERGKQLSQSSDDRPSDSAQRHHGQASLQHKIIMLVAIIAPFLGFIAAIVLAWQYQMVNSFYLGMLFVGWFATGVGITVGFHRMLTHRSFDTYDWVRVFWAGLGSLAIEGPPLGWCAVHRKHHQHSDHVGDPHSPLLHGKGWLNAFKGCWHAHAGWLFGENWSDEILPKYVPDLIAVKGMKSMSRHYVWFIVASLLLPAAIGGLVMWSVEGILLGFLWGGLARVFLTHHVTWSVNSMCHLFGAQDYESHDGSRNNALFGILSHGEGWHNNHHAFPTSARHGLKWWQFDSSWLIIRAMSAVGLVWNIRTPSEKALAAKARK